MIKKSSEIDTSNIKTVTRDARCILCVVYTHTRARNSQRVVVDEVCAERLKYSPPQVYNSVMTHSRAVIC
jgi:hypothetical protein